MGWILFGDTHHDNTELMSKYAPDLGRDQFYRWLNTYHWVPLTATGLILLAIGGWPMSTPRRTCGARAASRRAPIRATAGGSRS